MVIDPLVIAFAFLAWHHMKVRQPLSCAAWLAAAWMLAFGLMMTASHSWPGLFSTIFTQNSSGQQNVPSILNQIGGYSGLIIGLAVIGAIVSHISQGRSRAALLGVLCLAAFVVPVAQLTSQTTSSLDGHLAYGIWFAAIAAGYACSTFIQWLPGSKTILAGLCCVVAFSYPAATSWQSAWGRYHSWPNSHAFITAFEPVAARSQGLLYLPGLEAGIAKYYTPQGEDWKRWSGALSLDPSTVSPNALESYFVAQLRLRKYGVIALFYSTTFSSIKLPEDLLLPTPQGTGATPGRAATPAHNLLSLVGDNSGDPGLAALTTALNADPEYRRSPRDITKLEISQDGKTTASTSSG